MQTIIDAIPSLQVIYEHKIFLPFRRAGYIGRESKRKHFRRFYLPLESLATEILCIALIPRLMHRVRLSVSERNYFRRFASSPNELQPAAPDWRPPLSAGSLDAFLTTRSAGHFSSST